MPSISAVALRWLIVVCISCSLFIRLIELQLFVHGVDCCMPIKIMLPCPQCHQLNDGTTNGTTPCVDGWLCVFPCVYSLDQSNTNCSYTMFNAERSMIMGELSMTIIWPSTVIASKTDEQKDNNHVDSRPLSFLIKFCVLSLSCIVKVDAWLHRI